MAGDQTIKPAVTVRKREDTAVTMTTTPQHHLLAEDVNVSGGQDQSWSNWIDTDVNGCITI